MYEKLVAEGLCDKALEVRMNEECREQVTQLLMNEDWDLEGTVGIYQDVENPHLWNVYDSEPDSRHTLWTFNTQTEQLQKRV